MNRCRFGLVVVLGMVCAVGARATEYTYADPVFRVDNPAESVSNDLVECTFTKTVGGETVGSSWAEFSAATAGTLVKEGTGWITITSDLSKFTGEIHAEEGVLQVRHFNGLGSFLGGAGYVHNGATIYMDQHTDSGVLPNATPYDSYCTKALCFEGKGDPSVGAALYARSVRSEANWPLMRYPTLTGDATLIVDCDCLYMNWRPETVLRLNGHTLTLLPGKGKTLPKFRQNGITVKSGDIVCKGVTYNLISTNPLEGDASNVMTLEDSAGFNFCSVGNTTPGNRDWTLDYRDCAWVYLSPQNSDGMGYKIEDVNSMAWFGPVKLGCDMKLRNDSYLDYRQYDAKTVYTNAHHIGFRLKGPVSGAHGITLQTSDVASRYSTDITFGLYSPENTFTGGVTLGERCILDLGANGALPKDGGAATLHNGSQVYLTGDGAYELPDLNLDGTCQVTQTSTAGGRWKDIVKTGEGALTYKASAGADSLDLRGGSFKLDWLRMDLIAGLAEYTNKYESTRFEAGEAFPQGITSTAVRVANKTNGAAAAFAGGVSSGNFIVYRGYIWNTNTTDVTWSFLAFIDCESRVFIDDVLILSQTSRGWGKSANMTLTPGPHKFEFRYRQTGGNSGAISVNQSVIKGIDEEAFAAGNPAATGENGGYWLNDRGFVIDRQGRLTHDCRDYETPVDPGDGSLFTVTSNMVELAEHTPLPVFDVMKFAAGTVLDLNGLPRAYEVAAIEGLPAVSNGDLTVTASWTVDAAEVAAGVKLTATGKFTLGEGAKIVVTESGRVRRSPAEGWTLAEAEGGIELPDGWQDAAELPEDGSYGLRLSADGKKLVLTHVRGAVLIVR